jgi:hypothetical protein
MWQLSRRIGHGISGVDVHEHRNHNRLENPGGSGASHHQRLRRQSRLLEEPKEAHKKISEEHKHKMLVLGLRCIIVLATRASRSISSLAMFSRPPGAANGDKCARAEHD